MHFYTHNSETETNNPIYNYIKRIKYSWINLTKEVKDLDTENYASLMEYIEDDPQNEKTYHVHEFEEFIKMNTLTKAISRFNAIHIKCQ